MNQGLIHESELRNKIITELNIGHLSAEEQEEVIAAVSDMLVKKVTLEVMRLIPDGAQKELDELADKGDIEELQKIVAVYVPNIQEVVTRAAQEGLAEHKKRVAEIVASGT